MKLFRLIILLTVFLSPRIPLSASTDHFQWRDFYEPIHDQDTHAHLQKAIRFITSHLGFPVHHINQVHLCLSQPKDTHHAIKRNFQLTETNDAARGEFTIYLSRKPSEHAYLGQLVHEATHLMNSQIHDAYFEGLSTLMAERYLKENGLDWSGWLAYFETQKDPFYAQTYFMMREIWEVIGDGGLRDFHTFTQTDPADARKLHINIDAWLQKLTSSDQSSIKKIIAKYAGKIRLAILADHPSIVFHTP